MIQSEQTSAEVIGNKEKMVKDGEREGRVEATETETWDRILGMGRELMEVDSGRLINTTVKIHLQELGQTSISWISQERRSLGSLTEENGKGFLE